MSESQDTAYDGAAWTLVDERWGRKAVEFADAQRAGQLPRVRHRPPSARGLREGPAARRCARQVVRDGLPLRAQINVVGYLARKPRPSQE